MRLRHGEGRLVASTRERSWRCDVLLASRALFRVRAIVCNARNTPVYQVLDAPRQPAPGNLSPFKRLYRACAAAACLIVAFIAVLPSLVLTFLALAGAVW